MRLYRESEVIDLIKILALGYGNKIDNEIAKTVVEGYRRAVIKHNPDHKWVVSDDNQEERG